MENTQEKTKKSGGYHRWLLLAVIAVNIWVSSKIPPILPHIQIAPEVLAGPVQLPVIGSLALTNTMVAMLIADVILILIAWNIRRATRKGEVVLSGLNSAVEAILEAIYNLVESTAGKWTSFIFPWVATIILTVLVANWMELIPGVDSIGMLHEVHGEGVGYPVQELFHIGNLSITTIVKESAEAHADGHLYGIIPFVRVNSTDLNFPLALALVSVFITQIIGVKSLGLSYFNKFFAFEGFFKIWRKRPLGPFDVIMPLVDIFLGVLELIAEVARIISFTFRLFGNIFAGSVLLFVIGSLVPVLVQTVFVGLEFFVGFIQALVFGMLTMVFMSMAAQGHGEHEEGAH
ncbi:MAG: F0F1 ATP synthase subunit A [Anaerolineales bacterium]|nr:F0F1 ATP synthase subunit A [Anaerolineales bacterium]